MDLPSFALIGSPASFKMRCQVCPPSVEIVQNPFLSTDMRGVYPSSLPGVSAPSTLRK